MLRVAVVASIVPQHNPACRYCSGTKLGNKRHCGFVALGTTTRERGTDHDR